MSTRSHGAERRVVITGTGVVTAIGQTVDEFWDALVAGRSGIRTLTSIDTTGLATRIGAEIVGFDPVSYMSRVASRRMDHFSWFAVAAAKQAMEQSGLTMTEENGHRLGVLMGTGYAANVAAGNALDALISRGPKGVSTSYATGASPDNASSEIALQYGAEGPTAALVSACATGTSCVGEAMWMIRQGRVDAMIAGGSDDPITRLDIAAMCNIRALSRRNDEPERASRPFDRDRDGFVLGAGGGALVLEEAEFARRRGATILAEVVGYGATTDAYHATAPHPEGRGARRAIRDALDDARLDPADIDYINAHGTSTPLNDPTEVAAVRAVLGERATRIPVSSQKSMIGHLIGGAGAVELVATVQTLNTGVVPPTLNCDDPLDTEMNFVPHTAQKHDVRTALSNSFGFGGHNAVLAVRAWDA